ncbi:MAG: hypothetical protein Q9206_003370 [Seirophora lacunosa]
MFNQLESPNLIIFFTIPPYLQTAQVHGAYLIYEKASHILWTTDKFVCDDDLSFRKFSAARKSSHMKKLAKVKFDVDCPKPRPRGLSFWQRLMVRFPGDIFFDSTITVTQADDQPPLLASTYAGRCKSQQTFCHGYAPLAPTDGVARASSLRVG